MKLARPVIERGSRLLSMPSIQKRHATTYESMALKQYVEAVAEQSPAVKQDLKLLEESPRIYHFQEISNGPASFKHETQTVSVRPAQHRAALEQSAHETHHGAQWESIVRKYGVDVAQQVFEDPVHRTALEKSALETGKSVVVSDSAQRRKLVAQLWKEYEKQPGYGLVEAAEKRLETSKFHEYSRQRLSELYE